MRLIRLLSLSLALILMYGLELSSAAQEFPEPLTAGHPPTGGRTRGPGTVEASVTKGMGPDGGTVHVPRSGCNSGIRPNVNPVIDSPKI